LFSGFNQNNDGTMISTLLSAGNQSDLLYLQASKLEGNEATDGNGNRTNNTFFIKEALSANYLTQHDTYSLSLRFNDHQVDDSGTPALLMDIIYIESQQPSLHLTWDINRNHQFTLKASQQDVEHLMDNYSLRPNSDATRFREALATADGYSLQFEHLLHQATHELRAGLEYSEESHDTRITNPNNPMLIIDNFNGVKKSLYSGFAEFTTTFSGEQLEFGARVSDVTHESDDIQHSMSTMMPAVGYLQNSFNQADRTNKQQLVDLVAKWTHSFNTHWQSQLILAQKQKAPSYQQLYLWLPMQSTGGLADGKTYVGDVNLDKESAATFHLGLGYENNDVSTDFSIFYNLVDNYIQGHYSNVPQVNMVATMMSDDSPLQFANTDANLYGGEWQLTTSISHDLTLHSLVSYVRGEDNYTGSPLYRIAPLNGFIQGQWQTNDTLSVLLTMQWADEQQNVSPLNNEQQTAGYVSWNLATNYRTDAFSVSVAINNLFDKAYTEHLAGTNRVAGGELDIGDKMSALGRNLSVNIGWYF